MSETQKEAFLSENQQNTKHKSKRLLAATKEFVEA
jgi:hypothetical protein